MCDINMLDYEKYHTQCNGCLSVNRTMSPIKKYSVLYRKLVPKKYRSLVPIENVELCWECCSMLRRMAQFQLQIKKANELLCSGQTYRTLSTLTSIIISDTINIVEADITTPEVKIKIEEINTQVIVNDEINATNDDSYGDFETNEDVLDKESPNLTPDTEIDTKTLKIQTTDNTTSKEKVKKTNKWAEKKALQNKKPKFKVLQIEDLNVNDIFKVVCEGEVKTECVRCRLQFENKKCLMQHHKLYHKKLLQGLTCDICNTTVPDKPSLVDHLKTHAVKYECSICSYSCHNKRNCQNHLLVHKQFFECIKCGLKFSHRHELLKHFTDWHEKFICDYCGKGFKMRYCIKNHIKKKHSIFECVPCNKRYARYSGLWLHKKVHHGGAKTRAYCVECDKQYPDVYRYRWHLANSARHTPRRKKRIPCPDCEKIFSKNIYMKDHYNLVHLKLFKYRCEECDKNFIRNADLVTHRKRIHEGILPPKNKICYVCGRGFTTNKILTNHLRTHSGKRPFACSLCPARFTQKTALNGHTKALHNTDKG